MASEWYAARNAAEWRCGDATIWENSRGRYVLHMGDANKGSFETLAAAKAAAERYPATRNKMIGNPAAPPGWFIKTATRDGYRVYERATEARNGALLRVEGFDPLVCVKQGLPAVWNWSAQTGGRNDKHGTAFALKRAVALAEAAGEKLNATRPRVNPKNPEGDSGAIPYKTWMKLTDALTAAHAAGQAWIHAGRPRPSPLYDAYNVADRELLRQEEAARWPYRGNAEQRKEWSRIHAHFDARKNPAPALYDAWVVVREKGPVLDPMGYASTLGPFFNKKQALAAKKKHGGRLVGIRPGHKWWGRNHPDTVRWFKGTKGQKEEVPWSIVEDMQHRTVRRFSTARQAESWADRHGYPYDWEKGENVHTHRVRGRKAPLPNPGTHPYHATLADHGWHYTHTTPVHVAGRVVSRHSYAYPSDPAGNRYPRVGVTEHGWEGGLGGSNRGRGGRTTQELDKYLEGAAKRAARKNPRSR